MCPSQKGGIITSHMGPAQGADSYRLMMVAGAAACSAQGRQCLGLVWRKRGDGGAVWKASLVTDAMGHVATWSTEKALGGFGLGRAFMWLDHQRFFLVPEHLGRCPLFRLTKLCSRPPSANCQSEHLPRFSTFNSYNHLMSGRHYYPFHDKTA